MADSYPEADMSDILVKLRLPNGEIKDPAIINVDNTVKEEKERFLYEAHVQEPYSEYIMVLLGPQGSAAVMDDESTVESCAPTISQGVETMIEIKKRRGHTDRPANPTKPKLFNLEMR